MNTLFNHAVQQSKAIKRDLDSFAEAPTESPLSLQGQVSVTLRTFAKTIDEYEASAHNEMVKARREQALSRAAQFRKELAESKAKFNELKHYREDHMHELHRSELLGRRTATTAMENSEKLPENPYNLRDAGSSGMTRQDGLSREKDVLNRAGYQIDEFLERGKMVLEELSDQKAMLKSTRQKITSTLGTLGLSKETIRLAESRAREDKWVFYGGICILIGCFYLIIRYFG